jgi:hypothetical protein
MYGGFSQENLHQKSFNLLFIREVGRLSLVIADTEGLEILTRGNLVNINMIDPRSGRPLMAPGQHLLHRSFIALYMGFY